MKDELLKLADRVEALTGLDREVDAEIALAIGVVPDGAFRPCAAIDLGTFATGSYGFWSCKPYTASLDAALALVPWPDNQTGLSFWIMKDYPGFTRCQVWHSDRSYAGYGVDVPEGDGRTKALALTAAALRALAQEQGDA